MSARIDPIRVLERCPWFRGVPVGVLHSVTMFTEQRTYRAAEVLLRPGEVPGAVLVVGAGELSLDGATEPFGPGALVWHLNFINNAPAVGMWTAKVATTALAFPSAGLQQLFGDQGPAGSAVRRALILSLSDQLTEANDRIAEHVAANPTAARPPSALLKDLDGVLSGARATDRATRR